jgi:hypothetical protein
MFEKPTPKGAVKRRSLGQYAGAHKRSGNSNFRNGKVDIVLEPSSINLTSGNSSNSHQIYRYFIT